MAFQRWLRLKGINIWYLVMAVMLNGFWILLSTWFVSLLSLPAAEDGGGMSQAAMLLAAFMGPLTIAWVVSAVAADGRGPTYGIYGSLGSVAILALSALSAGGFGVMLIIAALAGGLNGGLLSMRNR